MRKCKKCLTKTKTNKINIYPIVKDKNKMKNNKIYNLAKFGQTTSNIIPN